MVKCAPAARDGSLRGEAKKAGESFAAEVNVSGAADITVGQRVDSLDLASAVADLDPGTTRTARARVLAVG
jgi:hypothetical protein